jgi:hypothetical protein
LIDVVNTEVNLIIVRIRERIRKIENKKKWGKKSRKMRGKKRKK